MEKFFRASDNMKMMYSVLAITVVLVGFVLYSVVGAQDVMIRNTRDFLTEQSSNMGHDVEREFYNFEADMTYAAGQGIFSGLMSAQQIPERERNQMIRLYARYASLIGSFSLYDKTSMRTISLSNDHYFELKKNVLRPSVFPLTSSRKLIALGNRYYFLLPVYSQQEHGVRESVLAIEVTLQGFMNDMGRVHSVGDGGIKWFMDSSGQVTLISGTDSKSLVVLFPDHVTATIKEKLNYGFKDLIFHQVRQEGVLQPVISCLYPISLGENRFAVGFTVLQSAVLKDIRIKIIQITLLFTLILILVSYIFYVFLKVERQGKKELAEARENVTKVLDNLPAGVILYDEKGQIEEVNKAAVTLLGLEARDESHGQSIGRYLIVTEESGSGVKNRIQRGWEQIPVISDIIEMEMGGRRVKIMTFADISAIEEARRLAEESSRIKSEFIANISHEIRTPMNGVLASAEILEDMELEPEQREFVGIIKQSAGNLMLIINDILDLSKIESGKMQLENMPFNLREELGAVATQFVQKAGEKGVEIVFSVDPAVPETLMGDPVRLTQVATNMMSNGVKFTDTGTVALMVRVQESRPNNRVRLHISIADTGIGVPKDKQAVIFEPFTQADGSNTRKYGGTGLGTSISRELVELMGGVIWVESPNTEFGSGRGTIFHIELDFPVLEEHKPVALTAESLNTLILIENKIAAAVIQKMLGHFGVDRVRWVKNGHEAVKAVAEAYEARARYDLILCDFQTAMKEHDFFEALRGLDGRGENDDLLEHVWALTYFGNEEQQKVVKRHGVQWLEKPIMEKPLGDVVMARRKAQESDKKRN